MCSVVFLTHIKVFGKGYVIKVTQIFATKSKEKAENKILKSLLLNIRSFIQIMSSHVKL